jgi:predicted nucleic acid-binding Zn ribbon protein
VTEKRGKSRPTTVGRLLESVFRGTPAEKRLREGQIWLVWDAAVGAQVAARARPARFADGVLTVTVASAPWMQQLTFLKKHLIEQLNSQLGCDLVRDIYLKAGVPEAPLPDADPLPPKRERPLSASDRQRIAAAASAVDDPELRESFARLFARHLASRDGD